MKTRLILVGGFLGAGKTTLIWESARKLSEQGIRVGLITNDQTAEIVDTILLEYANKAVQEVSGSCFCCNFDGLSGAIKKLSDEDKCELIFAEPVGSCTDLSATIIQPLKQKWDLHIAPLTVLVDPGRLSEIIDGDDSELHNSAVYVFRKQLDEADIIMINKTDLLDIYHLEALKQKAADEWPFAEILSISAKTGEGLKDWMSIVMNRTDAGTHITEVDYDIYAEGEAVLGWYNASFTLKGNDIDWYRLTNTLIHSMAEQFEQKKAAVGHVKIIVYTNDEFTIANLTGKSDTITIRGNTERSGEAKLTVNARVQMDPEELENIMIQEIDKACNDQIEVIALASNSLRPGRPDPTYRYNFIVS